MKLGVALVCLLAPVWAQTPPDQWDGRKRIEPQRSATGSKAMIAGTSEPLAVHAGLEVLKHGGNAADAALTAALAQVALTAGAAISYAGILTAVNQPNTQGPYSGMTPNAPGKPEYEKEAIARGDFPQSVIEGVEARGQPVKLVDRYTQPGYWIGIQIGPHRQLTGAGTPLLPALVEGY